MPPKKGGPKSKPPKRRSPPARNSSSSSSSYVGDGKEEKGEAAAPAPAPKKIVSPPKKTVINLEDNAPRDDDDVIVLDKYVFEGYQLEKQSILYNKLRKEHEERMANFINILEAIWENCWESIQMKEYLKRPNASLRWKRHLLLFFAAVRILSSPVIFMSKQLVWRNNDPPWPDRIIETFGNYQFVRTRERLVPESVYRRASLLEDKVNLAIKEALPALNNYPMSTVFQPQIFDVSHMDPYYRLHMTLWDDPLWGSKFRHFMGLGSIRLDTPDDLSRFRKKLSNWDYSFEIMWRITEQLFILFFKKYVLPAFAECNKLVADTKEAQKRFMDKLARAYEPPVLPYYEHPNEPDTVDFTRDSRGNPRTFPKQVLPAPGYGYKRVLRRVKRGGRFVEQKDPYNPRGREVVDVDAQEDKKVEVLNLRNESDEDEAKRGLSEDDEKGRSPRRRRKGDESPQYALINKGKREFRLPRSKRI